MKSSSFFPTVLVLAAAACHAMALPMYACRSTAPPSASAHACSTSLSRRAPAPQDIRAHPLRVRSTGSDTEMEPEATGDPDAQSRKRKRPSLADDAHADPQSVDVERHVDSGSGVYRYGPKRETWDAYLDSLVAGEGAHPAEKVAQLRAVWHAFLPDGTTDAELRRYMDSMRAEWHPPL